MMRSAPWRLTTGVFAGLAALYMGATALAYATPRIKPPAPGPVYLSQSDHDRLLEVAKASRKKRFSEVRAQIPLIADPIARSLAEWMYFMAEDPLVSISDADAFLDAHASWPAASRIQAYVEGRIPSSAPAKTVLAFFESRDPMTGDGKIQLARAMFATGQGDAGEIYLRDGWVNNNFTVSGERKILASYSKRLSQDDHAARVDRLLWARQVTNARRIIPKLKSSDRRMAEARAALLMRAATGPKLYSKLSREQQLDSGVLLAAVRYYRRTGDEQRAIALAAESPKDPQTLRNSARWWSERQLLMRWALKNGRFADAYTASSNHGLDPSGNFAEAEFNAGWIALRFLNQPERAETHFLALASAVGTPISLSRAYYWLGRSAAARNKTDLAKSYYQTAAQHYYSYYGQLAAEELGGAALTQKFAPPKPSTPRDKALFTSRPTVAALRMLSDLNLDYEFMVFAYHVDDQLQYPGEYTELAKLTNGEGAPHLTVRAGKVAIKKDAFTPDVAYPLVFIPDEAKRFVSPEIILGLSRQESEFNPRAYSHAGARGMMQLIPSTAQITARKEGLRYSRAALLDDPSYNMTLGSAHLSHLLSRFEGSLIMTFAAYNAGAGRVDQWVERYGDPREPGVDPLDWVELIPFSETRNYVQRVLENTQVYRGRLNDAPIPGKLSSDLERGGVKHRVASTRLPAPDLFTLSAAFGEQKLSPLPERTAQFVKEFKMAQAAIQIKAEPAADTSGLEAALTNARDNIAKSESEKAAPLTEPASPAADEAQPLTEENDPPETESKAISPAPVALTSPATLEDTQPEISQPVEAAPESKVMQAARSTVESLVAQAGLFIVDDAEDEAAPAQYSPAANTATTAHEAAMDKAPMDDDGAMNECLLYRDFIARNAEDDGAAADLNAGMLAELQSDGSACN